MGRGIANGAGWELTKSMDLQDMVGSKGPARPVRIYLEISMLPAGPSVAFLLCGFLFGVVVGWMSSEINR